MDHSIEQVRAGWWEKSLSPVGQETVGGKFLSDPYDHDLETVSVAARGADPDKFDLELIEDDLIEYAMDEGASVEEAQERIEELRAGEEPTEDEMDTWQSYAESAEIFQVVAIYKGETPHGSVWWVSEESRGIAMEQLVSWGPYRAEEDAKAKEQEIVARWSQVDYVA